jgi:transcriptional regulator NrdR family protein
MKCPHCNSGNIRVIDTLPGASNTQYRRRKCKDCGGLFKTVEVIGNDGEGFERGYSAAMKRRAKRRNRDAN